MPEKTPENKETPKESSKLVIELKELDEVYSRFKLIFILTNVLTCLLAVYIIANLMYPERFEAEMSRHLKTISFCVLLGGAILLCLVQGLCLRKTTQSSRHKIERLTFTDALTGVYNYRYLDRRLDEELRIAQRFSTTVSVLYIDIDNFKQINDDHGHEAGNLILREIGRFLSVAGRSTDLVGRLGGDEFLIIFPNTAREEAQLVAERIRTRLEKHTFQKDQTLALNVCVSMGVAAYPSEAQNKQSLITEADKAMYRAKQGGGNRVCI